MADPLAGLDTPPEDGPTDAAGAIASLGVAHATPEDAPPVKRGRGRPRKHPLPDDAPGAPIPQAPPDRDPTEPLTRATKADLIEELKAARVRLAMLDANPEELAAAKETVQGLFVVITVAAGMAGAAEFGYSDAECSQLGDAFARPMLPYLAKMGEYQEWTRGLLLLAMITWPKWRAYIDRKEQERTTHIEVTTPPSPPNRPERVG